MLMYYMSTVVCFFLCLITLTWMNMKDSIILINKDIMNNNDIILSMTVIIDKYSMMFSMMVTLISTSVSIYSFFYMKSDKMAKKFFISMMTFILSMVFLSISGNMFWTMVCWDWLGMSSFVLILYFQNWNSMKGSVTAFLMNRMGDLFMILCMGMMINFLSFSTFNFTTLFYLITIVSLTKSAQAPFSSWLPMAMAAPTPVSSLVHSSTLVTAGAFLLIRFIPMYEYMKSLSYIACVTMSMASICALYETNLKKIIAMSTMSHMGLIFLFISMNSIEAAMLHLIMHAVFKSSLFMSSGFLIHNMEENQDMRFIQIKSNNMSMMYMLVIPVMSMSGLPFMSGFYSKELMLTSMNKNIPNLGITVMTILAVTLTCAYSMRMVLNWTVSNRPLVMTGPIHETKLGNVCYFTSLMSIIAGTTMIWSITSKWHFIDIFVTKSIIIAIPAAMIIGYLMGLADYKYNLIMINSMYSHSMMSIIQTSVFKFSISAELSMGLKSMLDHVIKKSLTEMEKMKQYISSSTFMHYNLFYTLIVLTLSTLLFTMM